MRPSWKVSRRLITLTVLAVFSLSSFAADSLAAQGGIAATITGQVTDESGAILPGVTVSATSPALQVPQVTAVTDARGEYRLTPLPIGTYAVTYELSGFVSNRREEIRLTVGFTARVDVVLGVGAVQETVTVSGSAPLVDVASTTTTTQLTRETLELLPTSRNSYNAMMIQTPSARTSVRLDVGGSGFNDSPQVPHDGPAGRVVAGRRGHHHAVPGVEPERQLRGLCGARGSDGPGDGPQRGNADPRPRHQRRHQERRQRLSRPGLLLAHERQPALGQHHAGAGSSRASPKATG